MKNTFTYLLLILTMFFWGGTFIAGRMLAESVPSTNSAFLRFFIASCSLIILVYFKENKIGLPPVKQWLPLLLLGATGVFAYNIFFFKGLQHINAGRASLIIALNPLVITLCAALFLGEKLTRLKILGVLISLGGAVLVISRGDISQLFSGSFGQGEAAILVCVASWSAYSLIGRTVLKSIKPLTAVCYSSIIGTILLLFPALQNDVFIQFPNYSMQDWLCLSYLGLLGTTVGFSLYYYGITQIGATRAGIFINLVPIFAILLSWSILGEAVQSTVLLGGILVLAGVTITNLQLRKS